MASIKESPRWVDEVYQIKRGDKVEGGANGIVNVQTKILADRTQYLKNAVESVTDYREYTFYKTDTDPDGTIAGIAATNDDQLFRVAQGVGNKKSFSYYRNVQGHAVHVADAAGVVTSLDIKERFPAAEWLEGYSIIGNSTMDYVTINHKTGVTGVCVLIPVPANTTIYIGMPDGQNDRFRILDLPEYPVDDMQRAGSRYSYNGEPDGTGNFNITFDGVAHTCKKYTTAGDAKFLLVYQSYNTVRVPVIFSLEKESNYHQLSEYAAYQVLNDLTLTDTTVGEIKEAVLPGSGLNLVAVNDSSTKLVGLHLDMESSQQQPALLNSSIYGDDVITWIAKIAPGKRYTLVADIDMSSTRFRVGAYETFPERRAVVTHMINGLTEASTRREHTESNGVNYSYITFDTTDNDYFLAMNLTDTNYDVRFALVEGEFEAGLTYKAITENIRFGAPAIFPYAEIDYIKSKMFSRGKNLFDGHYLYGFSPNVSANIPGEYSVFLNAARTPIDPTYKEVVAAVVPCLPNKKYAISRKGGSRFFVGAAKSMPTLESTNVHASPMKTLINDNSLDSAVIETGPADRFLYVYLSNASGVAWVQIELGGKVTAPETPGWKFSQAAEAIATISHSGDGGTGGYISAGVGDGLTDDSDDLQSVINLLNGVISFDPEKRYLLGKTLYINASLVKALLGNRATFIVEGDFPAFRITGPMASGSANPATNGAVAKSYGGFLVDGIRVYGYVEGAGTGLHLSGMFKPRIQNCDIMYLQVGVRFSGLNRDVIIGSNHIYACWDYGIYFDDSADIHQLNILGNIITYCTRNIFLDNADIYNLQIVVNDIELGTYPPGVASANKANIWINALTSLVEDVSMVGNTLEDHWTSQRLVYIKGMYSGSVLSVVISGNSAGNSLSTELEIGGASGVDISGQFKKSYGYTLGFIGDINGLKMGVQAVKGGGKGGLVISEGKYNLQNVIIHDSQISGSGAYQAIRVTGKPTLKNWTLRGLNIYDKSDSASIYIDAGTINGLRADLNQIDNSFDTAVTQAIVIKADEVLGKNSLMLNSATKGAFVAPDGFNVQGNF
ncbi:right-handed parallel beta-helix repeat-containing protein [Klebsiella pneumoniae]|uniref:right-handed parallel beta-helix repeat-containing protein n=1 Tax=Klebsiella pneumoniae TaxID=573 RepID=UPI00214FCCE1|nr:right-handed parallel beta-helix repeat-containing protein [Klebsiella pneumoniae]MCR4493440.1 hypothetical protein [Klebsiella pneumoniae]